MDHRPSLQPSTADSSVPAPAWRRLLGGIGRALAGLLLAVSAVVVMLGALLVAVVLTVGLVIWALLRGRRPAQGVFNASFQRARRGRSAPLGEVVDVEVREVPDLRQGPKPGA
jgi:hypothetical protein